MQDTERADARARRAPHRRARAALPRQRRCGPPRLGDVPAGGHPEVGQGCDQRLPRDTRLASPSGADTTATTDEAHECLLAPSELARAPHAACPSGYARVVVCKNSREGLSPNNV